MPLYPLDAVRNAPIDRELELLLEDVREELIAYPFAIGQPPFSREDILEVYDLARPRLNVLLSLLQDGSGADIGTGFGFLPVLLQRRGIRTVATERDPSLARFAAAHGITVYPYAIGRLPAPFKPESLDFLILAEVLEHLKLPATLVVRELSAFLRPGGRFLLTTPNVARLAHIETLCAGENFLEPFPEDVPLDGDATNYIEHVREYSVREAVEALEGAGLAVEAVLMTGWGESGYQPLANPFVNEIIVAAAAR